MREPALMGADVQDFVAHEMEKQGLTPGGTPPPPAAVRDVLPFEITSDWTKADGENVYSCRGVLLYFDGKDYQKDENGFQYPMYSPLDMGEKPSQAVGDRCWAVLRGGRWEIVGGAPLGEFETVTTWSTMIRSGFGYTTDGREIYGDLLDAGLAVEAATNVLSSKRGTNQLDLAYTTKRSIYPALSQPGISYNTSTNLVTFSSSVTNIASGGTQYMNWRIGPRSRGPTEYGATFTRTAYTGAITQSIGFPCFAEAFVDGNIADGSLLLQNTAGASQKMIKSPINRFVVNSTLSSWQNQVSQNALAVSPTPPRTYNTSDLWRQDSVRVTFHSNITWSYLTGYTFRYSWRRNNNVVETATKNINDYIYTPRVNDWGEYVFNLRLQLIFNGTTYPEWNVGDYTMNYVQP